MKKAGNSSIVVIVLLNFYSTDSITQNPNFQSNSKNCNYSSIENNEKLPCITNDEYKWIEIRCNENIQSLERIPTKVAGSVLLAWPLQPAANLKDCSYYYISAFVDQNTATTAFQDFNCGTNTYDGHRGTDISIWPYNFYKMDNNLVEVIAAAPGIIVDKHDGEFDKNCSGNNLTANYIVIQHNDGSRTLYWHMKKNSLTPKAIGQPVVTGEFLGIVGSSGSSSGPHLHFEVWSGSTITTRIDPFSGTCNSLNSNSWWASQKSYMETAIIKASVNTTDLVLPPCPGTEIPNESSVFQMPFQGMGLPAGYAKFYISIRNEKNGLNADLSILNPDGSVFLSWTYTSTADIKVHIQGWSKKLPTVAGKYIFKSVYNGISCSTPFEMVNPTHSISLASLSTWSIYPNPSHGKFIINSGNSNLKEIEIYNLFGTKLFQANLENQQSEIDLSFLSGLYYYRVKENNHLNYSGKIRIE